MDTSPHSPACGVADGLSPKDAKRFFEFFSVGTHREVLMLGDLVEQPVHYVRSKGHKVLCASRTGVCELCEKSDADDAVSIQQVEYYAPSYVRPWREREFSQRVAVFSAAAGEEILRLIGDGAARGHRLDVERYSQGNSGRFRIKHLDGLPKGFPAMLPPAFDLVPFVRARFGKRQDPARPLVFLPAFKVEGPLAGSPGRPKVLDLSAEDVRPSEEAKAKLRAKLESWDGPQAAPAQPVPTAPADVPQVLNRPQVLDVPVKAAEPTDGPELLDTVYQSRLKSILNSGQAQYGPRRLSRPALDLAAEDEALTLGTGELVCGDLKARGTVPFSKNGHHGKGGAK